MLTAGECVRGASCQIDALPELVAPGDCPVQGAEFLSGDSCQPECNSLAPPGSTIGEIFCFDGDVILPENTCLPQPDDVCGEIGAVCETVDECCDDEICANGVCGGPDGPARETRERGRDGAEGVYASFMSRPRAINRRFVVGRPVIDGGFVLQSCTEYSVVSRSFNAVAIFVCAFDDTWSDAYVWRERAGDPSQMATAMRTLTMRPVP